MSAAILEVRRRRGMTQRQVAARGNISENHVGKLERAEVPDPGLLSVAKIARGLDVSAVPFVLAYAGRRSTPSFARPRHYHLVAPCLALGATLRSLRRSIDLSQAALAEKASLAPTTLSLLEGGRKTDPALRTLVQIAYAVERSQGDRHAEEVLGLLVGAFAGETPLSPEAMRWLRRRHDRGEIPSIGKDT